MGWSGPKIVGVIGVVLTMVLLWALFGSSAVCYDDTAAWFRNALGGYAFLTLIAGGVLIGAALWMERRARPKR